MSFMTGRWVEHIPEDEVTENSILAAAIVTARLAHMHAGSPKSCSHVKTQKTLKTGAVVVVTTCAPVETTGV